MKVAYLAEPALLATLPRYARERVIARFSVDAAERAQMAVYEKVMAAQGATSPFGRGFFETPRQNRR